MQSSRQVQHAAWLAALAYTQFSTRAKISAGRCVNRFGRDFLWIKLRPPLNIVLQAQFEAFAEGKLEAAPAYTRILADPTTVITTYILWSTNMLFYTMYLDSLQERYRITHACFQLTISHGYAGCELTARSWLADALLGSWHSVRSLSGNRLQPCSDSRWRAVPHKVSFGTCRTSEPCVSVTCGSLHCGGGSYLQQRCA